MYGSAGGFRSPSWLNKASNKQNEQLKDDPKVP